jgi:hypothetical protein
MDFFCLSQYAPGGGGASTTPHAVQGAQPLCAPPFACHLCTPHPACGTVHAWHAKGGVHRGCAPQMARGVVLTHTPGVTLLAEQEGGDATCRVQARPCKFLIFRIGHTVQPTLHTPNLKFRFLNFLSLCIFMNKINYKTNKNKAKQRINNNTSPCICETRGKIIRHHPSSSRLHSLAATSPLCRKTHTHGGVQRGWGASIPPPPNAAWPPPLRPPPPLGPCWCVTVLTGMTLDSAVVTMRAETEN